MIQRDVAIRDALSLISAQTLLTDFENDTVKRNTLYNVFNSSIKYVAKIARMRMLAKRTVAGVNPNLGENWYYMPNDFIDWATSVSPAQDYCTDKYGQYSVKLASADIYYIYFAEDITDLDVNFELAVRWQFLAELSLSDVNITEMAQNIKINQMNYLKELRNETKFKNISGVRW